MTEISEKQLQANRENAKSGGIKTQQGKAVSRYNAVKHGLLSQEVLLDGEPEQTLLEMGKRMRSELKPVTEIERILVDRIIANTWRLKRALRVEKEIFIDGMESSSIYGKKEKNVGGAFLSDIKYDSYGKFIRYETSIERGLYKALHELQRLQAARSGDKVPAPIAIDVDVSRESQQWVRLA